MTYLSRSLTLGNRVNSNTVSGNIDNLRQLERLSNVWEHLSPSIKVPSRSTRSLSQRYVWIDSLCILQDNARNSKVNINAMHSATNKYCCWILLVEVERVIFDLGCSAADFAIDLNLSYGSRTFFTWHWFGEARKLPDLCWSSVHRPVKFFKQGYYDAAVQRSHKRM